MTLIRPFNSAAVRRRDRDRRTDVQRLSNLKMSVTVALGAVQADILRLARRNEQLRGWAGDLLGTEDGCTFEREPDDEADLSDAEQQLVAGLRRLAQLEESSQFLMSLQRAIEAHAGSAARTSAVMR